MLNIGSTVTILIGEYKGKKGIISDIDNQWYDRYLEEYQYGTYYSVKLSDVTVMGLEDYEIKEEPA